MNILSADRIAFTVLGYPMSYIELVGTLLYLWSVWLIAKRSMLTWPVGIASVVLFALLFYQIRLYSDAIEQVYYLGASVYGWWHWSRDSDESKQPIVPRFSGLQVILLTAAVTAMLSAAAGWLMNRVHVLLPVVFPEAASFPYIDALTTVMSFTAMALLALKRIESWVYWIIVDIIGIGLYYMKEVRFISLLYVLLLFLAIRGLVLWWKGSDSAVGSSAPQEAV